MVEPVVEPTSSRVSPSKRSTLTEYPVDGVPPSPTGPPPNPAVSALASVLKPPLSDQTVTTPEPYGATADV